MEVVGKMYQALNLGDVIKELNLEALNEIKNGTAHDKALSSKVKRTVCSLTEYQLRSIADAPVSLFVLKNDEFQKGITSGFTNKEITPALAFKIELLFTMQRMTANSAALEFAFGSSRLNHDFIKRMSMKQMKSVAQYNRPIFMLRKGFNSIAWENLIKIISHPETQTNNEIKEAVLLCLQ